LTPAGEAPTSALEARESEPSAAIFNAATVLFEANAANNNLPSGDAASEMSAQAAPTENGDPMAVRKPLFGSIEKALILPLASLDAYRWLPDTAMRFAAYAPPPAPDP